MSLINCKMDLELTWNKNCVLCGADAAADNTVSFQITDTKLYVPIVTLSTKDNINLTKQLNKGFKRSVHWNKYQPKPFTEQNRNRTGITRFPLDAAFQGANRLFVLAFDNTTADDVINDNPHDLVAHRVQRDSYRKYYLPRVNITDYNVVIDDKNFKINQLIVKLENMTKLEKLHLEKVMIILLDVC